MKDGQVIGRYQLFEHDSQVLNKVVSTDLGTNALAKQILKGFHLEEKRKEGISATQRPGAEMMLRTSRQQRAALCGRCPRMWG